MQVVAAMMAILRRFVLTVLLCAIAFPVWADYQAAFDSYKRGDYATALRELKPLAEQGDATPQGALGLLYFRGWGVEQDFKEAVKWFRRAADQGNAAAQFNLSHMYEKGLGITKDYAEAVKWSRRAADQGHAAAQTILGIMYATGQGVQQDYQEAYLWFSLSAAQGDENGQKGRDHEIDVALTLAARSLSPAQLARVQERAGQWRPKTAPDVSVAALDTSPVAKTATPTPPTAPRQAADLGTFHALIIGNDAYRVLPRLRTAVKDAHAVAALLESRYGFRATTLSNATRNQVIQALDVLLGKLTERDNLLIYYAGHGKLDRGFDQGYWLPVDATEGSRINWISNATITDTLKAIRAKHVMVVADSCYSGTLTRDTRGIEVRPKKSDYIVKTHRKKSRTVLASGGLEPVSDSGGSGHSVFAKAFMDALRDNEGIIDGLDVFAFVRNQVRLNADQVPNYANIRYAGHEVGGDFLFARMSENLSEARQDNSPVSAMHPAPIPKPPDLSASDLKTFENRIAMALSMARLTYKPVTISEMGVVRQQLAKCWNLPAGAKDSGNLEVEIHTVMNRDGTVREARISDQARMLGDPLYRAMAESALRAVLNPRCSPLKLPPEKYSEWQVMNLAFNSAEMFGGTKPASLPPEQDIQKRAEAVIKRAEAVITRQNIFRVQMLLNDLGYDPGPIDGVMGRKTRAAIEDFQRSNGLSVDGAVTDTLLEVLKGVQRQIAAVRPASVPRPSSPATPAVGIFPKTYKPGDTFKDCADCPKMVVVPAGAFDMGDLNGGGYNDEKPVHRVTIPHPFAVGVYEVTQAEWRSVMGTNPSHFKGERNPVENVSWDDANDYVARLSAKTGKKYRLLSEAEWEYVARAGSRTKYPWGNAVSHDSANYGTEKCCNGKASGQDRWLNTSPVGSFKANAFGLYDTVGNVLEWTEDCRNRSYSGAPSNGHAWTAGDCRIRVLRGGSWKLRPRNLRSAFRYWYSSSVRNSNHGYRIARRLHL
jgi:formylglycine-generating enzyme required for sulfatase activity